LSKLRLSAKCSTTLSLFWQALGSLKQIVCYYM